MDSTEKALLWILLSAMAIVAFAVGLAVISVNSPEEKNNRAFVANMRTNPDAFQYSDEVLVAAGRNLCRRMDSGTSVKQLRTETLNSSNPSFGLELIDQSVAYLCPENKDK